MIMMTCNDIVGRMSDRALLVGTLVDVGTVGTALPLGGAPKIRANDAGGRNPTSELRSDVISGDGV